jgi:hypothetical protein
MLRQGGAVCALPNGFCQAGRINCFLDDELRSAQIEADGVITHGRRYRAGVKSESVNVRYVLAFGGQITQAPFLRGTSVNASRTPVRQEGDGYGRGPSVRRNDLLCTLRCARRSAKERLVSYHCAQRRYLSAMLFHAALFSLLRRKLAIWPHSMAWLRSSSDEFMGRLPVLSVLLKLFDCPKGSRLGGNYLIVYEVGDGRRYRAGPRWLRTAADANGLMEAAPVRWM